MGGPRDDGAREEFLAEAQELIEGLSRDLLLLDEAQKRGSGSPETLNDLFRGVHTLKGLAGMFGYGALSRLSHILEDLLEDLRLGRVELSADALDVLFRGVDDFQRLLAEAKDPSETAEIDMEAFERAVHAVGRAPQKAHDVLVDYELDPGMLSVLTEYEEHRLRTNLERGQHVYRLRTRLALDSIDSALERLKQRCAGTAEIITYLPSMDGEGGDSIDIEMLIATKLGEGELRELLSWPDSSLVQVMRRGRLSRSPSRAPSKAPPPPAEPVEAAPLSRADLSLRSLANVVRVDIGKLDHLMNVVGELGTVRNAMGRLVERLRGVPEWKEVAQEAHRIHRAFNRHLGEVQSGVLDVRMVPLSQLFEKVAVIVRQVAREQGKEVRLVVSGAETEVDKLVAEELADPLMHIVRNAIDHGIEDVSERAELEKPSTATLAVNAYQRGNHVVIEIQDDGRGIDSGVVREAAIRKGLLPEQEVGDMSRSDLLQVIFLPGFSTREEVTSVSGRGVGMDVVKTNIHRLGGAVEVESDRGVGTKFTITLPITLAIMSALLFEVRGRLVSLPLASVQEALRMPVGGVRTVEGREVLSLRGSTLPLCRLGDLFGFDSSGEAQDAFVIVIAVGSRRLGLVVDRPVGQQDIVIKALGRSLAGVPGISGATDLGDGLLVLVLDAGSLLEEVLITKGGRLSAGSTV